MAPCRIGFASVSLALTAVVAAAQIEPITVVVTNTTMVVNGATGDIPSLIASPGGDGISFAEALKAAHGTSGPKLITFSPDLINKSIQVTANADERELFVIETVDLTIDGDIDRDGRPDISFVAVRNSIVAFVIRVSRVTINGLKLFLNSPNPGIFASCADLNCDEGLILGLHITGNEIENVQGSAIQIGPEAVRAADVQFLRPIVYDDVLISGNTMTVTDTAVSIAPSVDGVSGSRSRKLVVEKNMITGVTGVRVTTAHRFSPPMFGDDNLIDGLTISQNTFDTSGSAIQVFAADYGNSNNRITGLEITGNLIRGSQNGIEVASTMDGKPQRVGTGNVVENVTIASNQVTAKSRGITISGADLPLIDTQGIGFESNRVAHVLIRDNTVGGYTDSGVRVWGGFANAGVFPLTVRRNVVEDVTVSANTITGASKQAIGIAVSGGESRGGAARENAVRAISIRANRVSGNGIGVLFAGGMGTQAQSNTVDVLRFDANVLDGNDVRVAATENSNSAAGNAVRFPRRRLATH